MMMRKTAVLAVLSLSSLSFVLSGCSSGVSGVPIAPAAVTAGFGGGVHGGIQPVSGANIQIFTAGRTGYGSAGTSMLSSAVTTLGDGSFSFAGKLLPCPSGPGGKDRLYLTATGGNPGFVSPTNNDALFLMTVIDSCQALNASSFFSVNEVSTVASVYALAQFINPTTGTIGSYGSSTTGINNAFDLAITLFNPATGTAYTTTPFGNGIVPQTEINTLANMITPCVNSTGSTSASCAALFPPTTGTATNTMLAMLYIATHPGTNVSTLAPLALPNSPFQPALTGTPNDFTMAVSYHTGAGVPTSLAIDGPGNVWIADLETGGSSSRLFKFNPQAVPAGGSPFSNSATMEYLAIDSTNAVWVLDPTDQRVSQFSSNGSSGITLNLAGTASVPQAIAIDAGNNPWVVDSGGNLTEVSVLNGGSLAFTGGGLNNPTAIAFDASGNSWVANSSGSSLSEFSPSGTPVSLSGYSGGGLNHPTSVAIDASGNVYSGNSSGGALSELSSLGAPVASSGYTFSSVGATSNIAVDGSGHLWSVGTNKLVSEVYGGALLSPTTGYQSTAVNQPSGIAIDPSGNLWVLDKVHVSQGGVFVNLVNFVGLATPVNTPLAANIQSDRIGQPAGTPNPVGIAGSTLPYFTPGVSYTAQLVAKGGNSGSYTWSLFSGALPGSMTISSTGLLSGIPTGSAATFTVKVADSALPSNSATAALTLSPATSLPAGANTANLHGSFAVLIKGFKGGNLPPNGQVTGFGELGSLAFDGAGNVTGQMDYNDASGVHLGTAVQGTYTVGSDLRGMMVLTNLSGVPLPQQMAFVASNSYQTIRFTEFDFVGNATNGMSTGIGKLQTAANFNAAAIGQNFVFGMDGETPCNTCAGTVSPFGPISAIGRIANSSGTTAWIQDGAATNTSYPGVTVAGTYTAPDATYGRGLFTVTSTGTNFPATPTQFVYYIVNSGEIFLLSASAHSGSSLLSGDAIVQSGTFSATPANNNGLFTGNYILSSSASNGGDGISLAPNTTSTFIVDANSTGTGTVTVSQDQNAAGLIQLEHVLGTIPYSIDGNGRMTLSGAPVIFYLASGTSGFGGQAPSSSNQGNPSLVVVQKQIGSSFSCSSPSGAFSFGNPAPPIAVSSSSTGAITFSAGTATATSDNSDPSGALTVGSTATFTCTSDAETSTFGRLIFTGSNGQTSIGYIVSPTQLVLVNATANKTKENLTLIEAQ